MRCSEGEEPSRPHYNGFRELEPPALIIIVSIALPSKHDPYQIWHSSQADEPGSSNDISYRNGEVDKLIEELRYTIDEEKQIELYLDFVLHSHMIELDKLYLLSFLKPFQYNLGWRQMRYLNLSLRVQ